MGLPTIPDINCLARALGLPKAVLTSYMFQSDYYYYKTFRIPKRSGRGSRSICAPSRHLKGIQRWILAFILRQAQLSDACTGFRPGMSILDNARGHVGKDFVLNMDLQDFFPSITTPRVVGLFKSLGYSAPVSSALARLTTHRGQLPQGAPTSPDIANLIARRLDARLSGYCRRAGWSYSRYCDDLTVSGTGPLGNRVLDVLRVIVEDEGFRVNGSKTRVRRQGSQQLVTGLVVNRGIGIPRQVRRRVRGMLHQATLHPARFAGMLEVLRGHKAFFSMVNPEDPLLKTKFDPALASIMAHLKRGA